MKKPPFHYVERAAPSEPDARENTRFRLLGVRDLKYYRMHTSTFVTAGRDRHRAVAKREIEQPPAILLSALSARRLTRWQIARHTIPVVVYLDSCHLVSVLKKQTGTPMASPFETVAQGQCSTTVLECQHKNTRTDVRFG